jgi:hypothetical protein
MNKTAKETDGKVPLIKIKEPPKRKKINSRKKKIEGSAKGAEKNQKAAEKEKGGD